VQFFARSSKAETKTEKLDARSVEGVQAEGTRTTIRVELALRGFMPHVPFLPFARRTGNITRADRGSRPPAIFTVPPGATVCESVHLLMHLTHVTCGARARADAPPGTTASSAVTTRVVLPGDTRIPAANKAIARGFGGRQLADPGCGLPHLDSGGGSTSRARGRWHGWSHA